MARRELGLKNSVEIAILMARLPLNWKLSRLKGLLGLTPCRSKSYNHKLRAHLAKGAASIYLNNKQHNRRIGSKILEDKEGLSLGRTLYILQLKILKTLKKSVATTKATYAGRRAVKAGRAGGMKMSPPRTFPWWLLLDTRRLRLRWLAGQPHPLPPIFYSCRGLNDIFQALRPAGIIRTFPCQGAGDWEAE
jgi:hypothetical protein